MFSIDPFFIIFGIFSIPITVPIICFIFRFIHFCIKPVFKPCKDMDSHRWQRAFTIDKASFPGEKRPVDGWLKVAGIVTEGDGAFCFGCGMLMPEEERVRIRAIQKAGEIK